MFCLRGVSILKLSMQYSLAFRLLLHRYVSWFCNIYKYICLPSERDVAAILYFYPNAQVPTMLQGKFQKLNSATKFWKCTMLLCTNAYNYLLKKITCDHIASYYSRFCLWRNPLTCLMWIANGKYTSTISSNTLFWDVYWSHTLYFYVYRSSNTLY